MNKLKEEEFFKYLSERFHINYTEEQKKAVLHVKGDLLLLASPGSGKTTVIIGRIGNLILNNNVDPDNIMAVTFSKSSAVDMKERFDTLFKDLTTKRPKFSTIHSFSMSVLRDYSLRHNITFQLIEDDKAKINKRSIIRECCRKINGEFLTDDKLEEIIGGIGYAKNMILTNSEIKSLKIGVKNFDCIYSEYENIKKENKYIDYDDMLSYTLIILQKNKEILRRYREMFEYIICDEAQDTSRIQHVILWLLGNGKNNIFYVADDDQSIYGFRGSYLEALKKFNSIYKNSNTIYMERNFRSSGNIVQLTNQFIKTNKERYNKSIYTENKIGEEVQVIKLNNEMDQTEYVIDEIKKLGKESIGILYRNNLSAISIANKLELINKPFFMRDNKINIFNHWILEDIKAFFTLAEDETNISALEKIYFKTDSYISRDMIEYIKKSKKDDESVFDILLRCPFIEAYNEKTIINFRYSLKQLKNKKPYFALDYLENNMKYIDCLNPSNKEVVFVKNNTKDILNVLKNIALEVSSMKDLFERIGKLKNVISDSKFNKDTSNITLTTIHSAKGLEYDYVYIIDLLEGILPGFESIEEEKIGKLKLMEEERRLFYVAMTRAKHVLKIITYSEKDTKKVYSSRFVSEVYRILTPENTDNTGFINKYEIRVGDTIIHKAFGKGVIISIEDDAVEINFLNLGRKRLLLSVCIEAGILKIEG